MTERAYVTLMVIFSLSVVSQTKRFDSPAGSDVWQHVRLSNVTLLWAQIYAFAGIAAVDSRMDPYCDGRQLESRYYRTNFKRFLHWTVFAIGTDLCRCHREHGRLLRLTWVYLYYY